MQHRESKANIKPRLQAAIAYVKNTCVLGSDNNDQDIKKTGAWVTCQKFRYQIPGKYYKASEFKPENKDQFPNLKFDEKNESLYGRYSQNRLVLSL